MAADSLYFEKGRPSRTRNTEERATDRGKSPSRVRYRPFSGDLYPLVDRTERVAIHCV